MNFLTFCTGNGQISQKGKERVQYPREMSETSETSSVSDSSESSVDPATSPPLITVKPSPASVDRSYRDRTPLLVEERSRSRDTRSRRPLQRTMSSGSIDKNIRLHSSSPTAKTKERIFVFEEINGKVSKFKDRKMQHCSLTLISRTGILGFDCWIHQVYRDGGTVGNTEQ